jgi:hypothetical protein
MKKQSQIIKNSRLSVMGGLMFITAFALIGGLSLLISHAANISPVQTQAGSLTVDAANPCGATTTPSAIKHVVWIWEENHSLSSVIGNSNAPYTTSLANKCGYAANMLDNVVPSLPSEPNYLAASSGSNCVTGLESTGTGCLTGDGDVSGTNSLSTNSIFQQVKSAGGTWRSYQEGMQSNCQLTSPNAQVGPYFYAAKHNPAAYFTNIRTDCSNWSVGFPSVVCSTSAGAGCGTIPASSFINDVRNGNLPAYSIITPNLNNDMHGTTALGANVPAGDNWLKSYMPEILNGPNYKNGDTMVVIMWDEGSAGGTIPNVVLAPAVPTGAKFTPTINNVGFLHTTEHLLGLSYLGCASGTQPGTSTACPAGSTADFSSAFNLSPGGSTSIKGDINNDGKVDILDLSILLSHWQTNYASADINKDGIVNILDLSILLSIYTV